MPKIIVTRELADPSHPMIEFTQSNWSQYFTQDEINNVFQINGDISDIELDYLKSKKFEHEYNRFLKHSEETD